MAKRVTTLYLSPEPFERLRKICQNMGKSTSEFIDSLIIKEVASLSGAGAAAPSKKVDYEELKREHERLIKAVDKIERHLKKRGVYNELARFAVQCGLNIESLANLEEIMPKMISEWRSLPEDVHQFISLLETVKRKRQVEKALSEIRTSHADFSLKDGVLD